jgi:L-xylulose reductase
LALRLTKCNATVIALSKTKEYLDILIKEEPKIQAICVNLRNWQDTQKAVKTVLPIDLLVNNAGVAYLNPFLSATENDYNLTFDINVKSIINISQIVAQNMIERKVPGSIVNVSSQASCRALKDHAIYSASKGALDILTK